MSQPKPILCLDFDGVLHSYSSSWCGASKCPDPPGPGAMRFIWDASERFKIVVYSSRSAHVSGRRAMRRWLKTHFIAYWASDRVHAEDVLAEIGWPVNKPAAFVTIDDRAVTFQGVWPLVNELAQFKPWNKRDQLP